jgi:hypothetical protein
MPDGRRRGDRSVIMRRSILRHSGRSSGLFPLVGHERHLLRSRRVSRATATSCVKVAQHPKGLTLTIAPGAGA